MPRLAVPPASHDQQHLMSLVAKQLVHVSSGMEGRRFCAWLQQGFLFPAGKQEWDETARAVPLSAKLQNCSRCILCEDTCVSRAFAMIKE